MSQSINQMEKPPYGIIAILLIGAFISLLNETLLNVALPSIMKRQLSSGFLLVIC